MRTPGQLALLRSTTTSLLGSRNLEGLLSPRITSELHLADPSLDLGYEPSFGFSDYDEDFDDEGYVEQFERARGRSGARACGGRDRRRGHFEFRYRF
nr:hypothetical protein Iba_chr02fCG1140 [Ipomoea batatas]